MSRFGLTTSVIFAVLLLALVPPEAKAYLDPGTGSFIAQAAIAFIIGGLMSFRRLLAAIRSIFKPKASTAASQIEPKDI